MWKVTLKDAGYNSIDFYFEKYGRATNFIHEALRSNKSLKVILTLENAPVEEGEE